MRARVLICSFIFGIVWTTGSGGAAQGKEPVKYHLRIVSQPLDEALQEFARQSGVQIIFFSRLTQGLKAPALHGEYTMTDAMTALLADSPLTFRVINPRTVEIRAATPPETGKPAPPPSRDRKPYSLRKTSNQSRAMEEVIVTASAEGLVATRTATPLSEIAQTVSLISHEQMRQQNDTDLADALDHAAGITVVRTNSLDRDFYSRGFQVTSFHVDGGAALYAIFDSGVPFLGTPDLSEFEQIEVLRGADALFASNGNPGGTVSMVRKRALDTPAFVVDTSIGTWSNYRVEADITGPLALDGAVRGRLDGVYSSGDYFYDVANAERKRLFATLEYDLSPSIRLTAGGSYQEDDALPFVTGLPLFRDGSDPGLPRSTALAFDWARYRTRMTEAYLQYRQMFDNDWQLRINASAWQGTVDYAFGSFASEIDPISNSLASRPGAEMAGRPNKHDQLSFDVTITGEFDWFGHREQVAIGGDFTRVDEHLHVAAYFQFGQPLDNVYAYDPGSYPDPRLTQDPSFELLSGSRFDQGGLFGSLRVFLTDDWSIVGGARISTDRTSTTLTAVVGQASASVSGKYGNSNVVTPYLGLMYRVNDHYSLYASYADIYRSFGNRQRGDGSDFGATNGVDIEVGIKGAWRDGVVNGSLVLYDIDQYNVPLYDPTIAPPEGVLACCYVPGTNKSRGVDVELSGEPTPGWLIGAGYTLNRNEAAAGGELSSLTPRHLLKVWTSKDLRGVFERWTVGGNLRAQSRTSTTGTYCPQAEFLGLCFQARRPFEVNQDPYVVLDLRAGFRIDDHWQAAVRVNNVFDSVYYETVGVPQGNNWYGEPRSVLLTIDGRY